MNSQAIIGIATIACSTILILKGHTGAGFMLLIIILYALSPKK